MSLFLLENFYNKLKLYCALVCTLAMLLLVLKRLDRKLKKSFKVSPITINNNFRIDVDSMLMRL